MLLSALMFLLFVFARVRDQSYFSPLALMCFIWFVSISLHELKIIEFYDLALSASLLIIGAFGFFFLGMLIIPKTKMFDSPASFSQYVNKRFLDILVFVLLAILALRFFSVVYSIVGRFGVSGLWDAGVEVYNLSRSGEWAPGVPVVVPIEVLSTLFISLRYYLYNDKRWIFYFAALMIVGLVIFLQSRFLLLLCLATYMAVRFSLSKLRLSLSIVVTVLMCATVLSLMRAISVESYAFSNETSLLASLGGVFYYVSSPIAGLNAYMERLGEGFSDSPFFFNGLLRLFSLIGFDVGMAIEPDNFYTPLRTISGTGLRMLYSDFGVFIFALCFFSGIGYSLLINAIKKAPTLMNIFFLACCYQFFTYSFMGLVSFNGGFWMFLFICLGVMPLLRCRSGPRSFERALYFDGERKCERG